MDRNGVTGSSGGEEAAVHRYLAIVCLGFLLFFGCVVSRFASAFLGVWNGVVFAFEV